MKVIVDTNVLVSAAVAGKNPGTVVVFIADSPQVEWIVSTEILTEYREVLNRRKLRLTEEQKQIYFLGIVTDCVSIIGFCWVALRSTQPTFFSIVNC